MLRFGIILFCAVILVGKAFAAAPFSIVATTSMITDTVRNIAGDRAIVKGLMGEGVDPHLYRQTRSDVVMLGQADLIFYNGLYLEAQLEPLLKNLSKHVKTVAVSGAINDERLLTHDIYKNKYDPHIWMDIDLWISVSEGIAKALADFDPEGADIYYANAKHYIQSLQALKEYTTKVLVSVPEDKRTLVTAHDAFKYFGRSYNFDVIGIQGISTESEAGLAAIEDIVSLVVQRKIKAIFVESSVSERNIKAIIEGARARGWDISIGGQLFSDAAGRPKTYEGTLIGMLDHNSTVIARALGGQAPEHGMLSRLGSGS